jgi:hypothetical protein
MLLDICFNESSSSAAKSETTKQTRCKLFLSLHQRINAETFVEKIMLDSENKGVKQANQRERRADYRSDIHIPAFEDLEAREKGINSRQHPHMESISFKHNINKDPIYSSI